MNIFLAGSLAGFAATVPMTAAMMLMRRSLPWWERYVLPPREITMEIAEEVGVKQHLSGRERRGATLVSHFSYGAAAGAVYAPLAEKVPAHPALKGAAFGLTVWAINYVALLPAAGMFPPVTDEPSRRNALMIVAHLVWGVSLGILADRWQD